MDRITHQPPRQQGYGSTSSLRNDSLKHTRKHERKGERNRIKEPRCQPRADCPQRPRGQSGQVPRTVRKGHADRPAGGHGPSIKDNRTTRTDPRKTDRPRRPGGPSAWVPDRPLLKPGPSANQLQRKPKTKPDWKQRRARTRRRRNPRTVCHLPADRPRRTDRAENCSTSKVNSPKSPSDFPNGWSYGDKGLGTWKASHKDAIAQKSCLLTP
jgi:hypothetical protein